MAEAQNRSRQTDPAQRLASVVAALRAARNPQAALGALAELRGYLGGLSPGMASTAIREFLDNNLDAPTQLGFVVGPDGFLKESPSVRVFLLDYLTQVDRSAAAACAENILSAMSSPDEWAVGLRNYALGSANPEAKVFLQTKLREMIANEAWRRNPSTGFFEAFDVAVYAGGPAQSPSSKNQQPA